MRRHQRGRQHLTDESHDHLASPEPTGQMLGMATKALGSTARDDRLFRHGRGHQRITMAATHQLGRLVDPCQLRRTRSWGGFAMGHGARQLRGPGPQADLRWGQRRDLSGVVDRYQAPLCHATQLGSPRDSRGISHQHDACIALAGSSQHRYLGTHSRGAAQRHGQRRTSHRPLTGGSDSSPNVSLTAATL